MRDAKTILRPIGHFAELLFYGLFVLLLFGLAAAYIILFIRLATALLLFLQRPC